MGRIVSSPMALDTPSMQIWQRAVTQPHQDCPWFQRGDLYANVQPIRVVIADDEAFARAAIRILLKQESDFQIVGTASNGLHAVETVENLRPDLLFLDIDMPGMDGFEVLNCVRRYRRLEVIFTTGIEALAARAFDVNALDYLLKPFTRARFRASLMRARERFQFPCANRFARS
ncbi:MAG TPA: response regulator [Clostridia bacterium]|nr:response regulator [Clostridia bacterium]